jgi:hypothetical protein
MKLIEKKRKMENGERRKDNMKITLVERETF